MLRAEKIYFTFVIFDLGKSFYMYMYVCMYVYVCVYIYIYTHTHTYIHTYVHIFTIRGIYSRLMECARKLLRKNNKR